VDERRKGKEREIKRGGEHIKRGKDSKKGEGRPREGGYSKKGKGDPGKEDI
jgi:hypothetical protein